MAKVANKSETPLMKQYYGIKRKHPDAILLFRVGDFYETFGEDAEKASKILGIILTKRKNGGASTVALAGFPHHSLDTYLPKLVRAGFRVAICDQLEDPKLTKKIVKRGVTELVTPGLTTNDNVLDQKSNNFLAVIHLVKGQGCGLSFVDISTGEFLLTEGDYQKTDKLLQNFGPKEILVQREMLPLAKQYFGQDYNYFILEDWVFDTDYANKLLVEHFGTSTLKGFGVELYPNGIIAAGVAMHYMKETRHDNLSHISKISRIEEDKYVWLDKFSLRNLEIFQANHEGGKSLLNVLDKTHTAMGGRLLKRWVALPLKDDQLIKKRFEVVEFFMTNADENEIIAEKLARFCDLERLLSKLATEKITPKEVYLLSETLLISAEIRNVLYKSQVQIIRVMAEKIQSCDSLSSLIQEKLDMDCPVQIGKGVTFNQGISEELDELRILLKSGKSYLQNLLQKETEKTAIPSLKLGFNNVFGYFLEVTNVHKSKVPPEWIRKQTLVNAERYITEELKEYEAKILGAEEKILSIELQLFKDLLKEVQDYIHPIQQTAHAIAEIDCLLGFALVSEVNAYVKPEIDQSLALSIKSGRHPVIEKELPTGESYVPNDVYLDDQSQQLIMITGPNMSGKSAILRQTALIVLMGQVGCFVPAEEAKFGAVDKIFTRVGASDNISQGESTFMVEMLETASILNNLSQRSLILLDEIGRGTSTYDGISIAWAIAEFLHEHPYKPKTLFATHYHELNEMSKSFERIKNFNVSVKEVKGKILFLRKLKEGGSEHSFGIHVAELAGVPKIIVAKAAQILKQLESTHRKQNQKEQLHELQMQKEMQLSFFQLDDPVLSQIKDEILQTDINALTPIEALMKLNEIKKLIVR